MSCDDKGFWFEGEARHVDILSQGLTRSVTTPGTQIGREGGGVDLEEEDHEEEGSDEELYK